jgi:hypothetical protein
MIETHPTGVFRNIIKASQLVDYTRLTRSLGTRKPSTPSDIDGVFDVWGFGWVFFEFKFKDAVMSGGQQWTYTRLVNDFTRFGKPAVFILVSHDVEAPGVVDAADCLVVSTYDSTGWHEAPGGRTVLEQFNKEVDAMLGRAI